MCMLKAGTMCKVISDDWGNFSPGDIVVTLEESEVPYCCLVENYKPNTKLDDYGVNEYYALNREELEVLNWRYCNDRTKE